MLHMEVVFLRCFVDLCGKYGARVDDCEQNARSVALGKPSECRDDIRNISRCIVDVMEVFAPRIPRDERLTRNDIFERSAVGNQGLA